MVINSTSNEKVKYFKKLRDKKYIYENKKFIVEGFHLVEEALKKNLVELIILEETEVFETDIETIYVTKEILKNISLLESTPTIMGVCRFPEENVELGEKVVILDGVRDPGNVGTIIRNSVAFNIDTVVLSKDSVSKYNDKLIRSTEGMIFNINVIEKDIQSTIKELKEKGIVVVGTSLNTSKYLEQIDKSEKYGIIFGNEGTGIKEKTLSLCDSVVKIKMNNNCESLNVAVSSGIVLHYMESK